MIVLAVAHLPKAHACVTCCTLPPPLLPSPAMKIGRNLVDARRQQGMLLL
jgi:hypothetical protein